MLVVAMLVIDRVPFEEVWQEWARDAESCHWGVEFLIHAKLPKRVRSSWARSHLLPVSFSPQWGSVELVRAVLLLLKTSVERNSAVQRVAIASESCVPVRSFAEVRRCCLCGLLNRADLPTSSEQEDDT